MCCFLNIHLVSNIYNQTPSQIPWYKEQYNFLLSRGSVLLILPILHPKTQISPLPHWHKTQKEQSQKLTTVQFLTVMLNKIAFY